MVLSSSANLYIKTRMSSMYNCDSVAVLNYYRRNNPHKPIKKTAHFYVSCGLQKLNTLNLRLFHSPSNPRNHFSTVLIKTNWDTISYKYQNCSGLESVVLYCKNISSWFRDLSNIKEVVMGDSVISIGPNAFKGCSGLTSAKIGSSVTSIGDYAFDSCSGLKSVTIPNNIASIGQYAFQGCSGLTAATIPSCVKSVGQMAFRDCSGLTSLTISDGTETLSFNTSSSSSPFSNCPLETLYLGRDVSYNGSYSPFSNNTALTLLTIGNNITSIGTKAFFGCSGLTSLTIPSNVTSISQDAFSNCSGLISISLYCDSIGTWFRGLNNIKEIITGDNVTIIGKSAFSGCGGLTSVRMGKGITSIEESAFRGCGSLNTITIPDKLGKIEAYTFYDCSSLDSVYIPKKVTSIGASAFTNCKSLRELTFENGADTLFFTASSNNIPFSGCPLENLYVGRNLNYTTSPFKTITSLTSLTIGKTVTTIEENMLQGGDKLSVKSMASVPPLLKYGLKCATLEVPYGTTCDYALAENWSDMENIFSLHDGKKFVPALLIVDGENFISLNDSTGKGIEIEAGGSIVASVIDKGLLQKGFAMKSSLDITNDLIKKNYYEYKASLAHKKNHVYSYAYDKGHTYIISVTKEGSLIDLVGTSNVDDVYNLVVSGKLNGTDILAIRKMANLHLLNMENAEIVDGGQSYYHDYITSKNSIGDYFFKDKESLVNIVLPNTVTLIKQSAFDGCVNLRSMNIPPSVTNIAYDVFRNCVSLQSFCIEDGKHPLSFESYSTKPFADSPLENLYMGRDITYNTYSYSPFRGQSSLLSLIVGDNVTYIGGSAFFNCSNMVSLVIGSGVKSIGDNAFYNCESLPSVIIPNSVTSLGESAFYGCSQLAYVSIGDGVSTIASSVFRGDKSLEYLIIGKNVTSIGQTAFADGTNIQVVKSLNTTPPVITASTFNETTEKNATLNVPTGYKTIYWLHPYWEDFANIEEIEVPEDISEKQSEALATYNDAMGIYETFMDYQKEEKSLVYNKANVKQNENDETANSILAEIDNLKGEVGTAELSDGEKTSFNNQLNEIRNSVSFLKTENDSYHIAFMEEIEKNKDSFNAYSERLLQDKDNINNATTNKMLDSLIAVITSDRTTVQENNLKPVDEAYNTMLQISQRLSEIYDELNSYQKQFSTLSDDVGIIIKGVEAVIAEKQNNATILYNDGKALYDEYVKADADCRSIAQPLAEQKAHNTELGASIDKAITELRGLISDSGLLEGDKDIFYEVLDSIDEAQQELVEKSNEYKLETFNDFSEKNQTVFATYLERMNGYKERINSSTTLADINSLISTMNDDIDNTKLLYLQPYETYHALLVDDSNVCKSCEEDLRKLLQRLESLSLNFDTIVTDIEQIQLSNDEVIVYTIAGKMKIINREQI